MQDLDSVQHKVCRFTYGEEIFLTRIISNNCCQPVEMQDIMLPCSEIQEHSVLRSDTTINLCGLAMKKLLAVSVVLLVFVQLAEAQKNIEVRDQTWFGYFNQTRFTNRSGVWVDLHQRFTGDFYHEPSVTIGRIGYIHYFSDHLRLVVGDAFVKHYAHGSGPDIPEHRPWQQLQWIEKKKGINIVQWLRVEERFRKNVVEGQLTDDYNFNWRFRYNLLLTFPFRGDEIVPRSPFGVFNNELHVNAGKNIVNNYFD